MASSTSAPTTARDRLVSTATRLFHARGITATGVDTVVAESGVSKPTLYAHFRSKEQLVAAVLERRHADRRAEVPAWVAEHADAPKDRLLAVFDWLAELYSADSVRGCAFLNAAAEAPDDDSPIRAASRRHKAWWRELFAGYARDAGLPAPEQLAVQLQLLCDGVHARSVVDGDLTSMRLATDQARAAAHALIAAADTGPGRRA